jgi:hypothetical protein
MTRELMIGGKKKKKNISEELVKRDRIINKQG